MGLIRDISLAVFVVCLSGGLFILEKRISAIIAVYEECTKQHTTTGYVKDCQDIQRGGDTESGLYNIYVAGYGYTSVWCDMETNGGGWTVFQRRRDGTIDFSKDWAEYKKGFGDVEGEFWIGNQLLHLLTSQGKYELRINLEDFDHQQRFALYKLFYVGGPDTNYRLSVGKYSGDAGDSMTYHNGQQFSTHDEDHDTYDRNCAEEFKGAWWYASCQVCNLNGAYLEGRTEKYAEGVVWNDWRGHYYSLQSSQMMVRRLLT